MNICDTVFFVLHTFYLHNAQGSYKIHHHNALSYNWCNRPPRPEKFLNRAWIEVGSGDKPDSFKTAIDVDIDAV